MRTRGLAARWGTSLVASALLATLLVIAGVMQREVAPTEPSAATTYLCSGYSGCVGAGYSDAGYGAVSGKMYWQMYSGHNCTNYAAYRVIKAGGPATRPWVGNGNASEWGLRLSRMTDQVPSVGAIAWWGRYSNGSGSAGHVAYVERVVSATEIIISEDSWGGTFHWRRITKSSGRWPTGFIHLVSKAITAKSAPTITGDATVDGTLLASPGAWSVAPTKVAYDWLVDGVSTGVTASTFKPRAVDLGKPVKVSVVATRSGYTKGVQTSAATPSVARASFGNSVAPSVEGRPLVDEVLTASAGLWAPAFRSVEWRWFADGKRIADATQSQLPVTTDLLGKEISMVPIVRQSGYFTAAGARVSVGTVVIGTIESPQPFTVIGRRRVGETLRVVDGGSTPPDAQRHYQWLRDGVPIAGSTTAAHRLEAADVGTRISVQVGLTKKNYAPRSMVVGTGERVRSPATVTLTTGTSNGVANVRVRVTAVGKAPVNGVIRIRVGAWRDTVRLNGGTVRVSVPLRPGLKTIGVRYLGSTVVPSAFATGSVRVR